MTKIVVSNLYQKENLSHMVQDYIKDLILRGIYKEGTRVLETELAEQLGISRGPVREAIKTLEQRGILTVEARKGAYVTCFDDNDVQEVFEIRLLLENSILEELINNEILTEEDFRALDQNVDEMIAIVESDEPYEEKVLAVNKKDIEFHQYLWARSGSKRKEHMLNDLFFQLRLAMLYDTRVTEDLMRTATDHNEIIKYLRAGDLANSKKALEDSIITM
ncbi:GntR family transcriptional regulator [Ruminococcaceae bacterium OttesenSCG-928-I18]|nr:GntR family transcriptional regulator [Ruminococcaceae bacterium OttesenSCG-928-I18]